MDALNMNLYTYPIGLTIKSPSEHAKDNQRTKTHIPCIVQNGDPIVTWRQQSQSFIPNILYLMCWQGKTEYTWYDVYCRLQNLAGHTMAAS